MSEPSRIPLYSPLGSRSSSILKDSRLFNGFAEKGMGEQGEIWVYKRPGESDYASLPIGAGLGIFNWQNNIYAVCGGVLYKDGVAKGSVNTSAPYTFTSCLGTLPKLFLKNTVAAYTYDDTNGLVQVTDTDYPAATIRGCVYIDGTTYVGNLTSGIFGSNFNDPQTWAADNVIVAQIEPDLPIAISKQLVYLICLKETETEVFYDAGNASGSPLGPVQGSKLDIGCRAAGSVCRVGGDLAWVGTTSEGDVQVAVMSRVQGKTISTPPVERLLKPLDFSTTWAWSAKVSGHRFYVVTLKNSNLTLAFDLSSDAWYIWTDASGNYMPIVSSTYDAFGNPLLQHESNGKIYKFDNSAYTDSGAAIPFKLYTPSFDGGLRVEKNCTKIEIVGDRLPTSVGVSWSDDDYGTFNTEQLVSLDQDRPWLDDGSSFARRAYLLTHSDSTFLRIKALDMTAQPGTL